MQQSYCRATSELTAADTWTRMSINEVNAASADIQAPGWARYITCIEASVSLGVAATGSSTVAIKLVGDCIGNKTMIIPIASVTGTGTSVTECIMPTFRLETAIEITPNAPLEIQGVISGTDPGDENTIAAVITFSDTDYGRQHVKAIMAMEGQVTTAATATRLGGNFAAGTLNDWIVPTTASKIAQVITCGGNGVTAKSAATVYKVDGNGLSGVTSHLFMSGAKCIGGTCTSTFVVPAEIKNTDIPVVPSNALTMYGILAGSDADQGTPEDAMALVFV